MIRAGNRRNLALETARPPYPQVWGGLRRLRYTDSSGIPEICAEHHSGAVGRRVVLASVGPRWRCPLCEVHRPPAHGGVSDLASTRQTDYERTAVDDLPFAGCGMSFAVAIVGASLNPENVLLLSHGFTLPEPGRHSRLQRKSLTDFGCAGSGLSAQVPVSGRAADTKGGGELGDGFPR